MKLDINHYFHNVTADTEALRLLNQLLTQGVKLMATQEELKAQLTGVSDKLTEASTEITAKIAELVAALAAAGSVTPEVQALADQLSAQAAGLADIVPNA